MFRAGEGWCRMAPTAETKPEKRKARGDEHVARNMRHAILMADRNLNISETVRARKV